MSAIKSLSTGKKVLLGFGIYFLGLILIGILFGSDGKNESFQPQEEFRLESWVGISIAGIDLSLNKAVLYLWLASAATIAAMVGVARKLRQKPGLVQMSVEVAFDLVDGQITRENLDKDRAVRWFPWLATSFFFILFSNLIGLIPLPTNTAHPIEIFGLEFPAFALYAATANISVPLILTVIVWFSYHVEGIGEHGFFRYFATWVPSGIGETDESTPLLKRIGAFVAKSLLFAIEAISHTVRLISLSVRLFANILAGHLLLLFMGGGLAVLLGLAAIGWLTFPAAFAFFVFEIVIVAGLQAFIFTILTAIYIGEATAAGH